MCTYVEVCVLGYVASQWGPHHTQHDPSPPSHHPTIQTPNQVYRFLAEAFTERGKASRNEADLRRAADAFEQAAEHLGKGPRAEKGAEKVNVCVWCVWVLVFSGGGLGVVCMPERDTEIEIERVFVCDMWCDTDRSVHSRARLRPPDGVLVMATDSTRTPSPLCCATPRTST